MLALYDMEMRHVVEPGEFEIIVGPSSTQGKTAVLNVVDQSR
jgi:hypothetical protein